MIFFSVIVDVRKELSKKGNYSSEINKVWGKQNIWVQGKDSQVHRNRREDE